MCDLLKVLLTVLAVSVVAAQANTLSSRAKGLDVNNNGVIDRNEARGPLDGNFGKVDCNKSGALALHEYPERPSVVALGEPRAVELAAMLVDLSVQKHRPSLPLLPPFLAPLRPFPLPISSLPLRGSMPM